MQPPKEVNTMMYWQVTMVDKYTGKSNIYMHIWLGGVEGYLQKASFLLSFCKTLLFLEDLAPRDKAQVHQQFFP